MDSNIKAAQNSLDCISPFQSSHDMVNPLYSVSFSPINGKILTDLVSQVKQQVQARLTIDQ